MKGSNIKKIRESFGLSVAEFSDLVGVQVSSIYRWESRGASAAEAEGRALQIIRLMEETTGKDRQKVTSSLRKGGWLPGLLSLLSASYKSAA